MTLLQGLLLNLEGKIQPEHRRDYLPRDFRLPKDTGVYLYGDRMVRVHQPTREVIDFVRIPSIKL